MPKASSLSNTGKQAMLLKGPPGFGKTIAACSLAVEGPIFLAYFDKSAPVELLSFYRRFRPELLDRIEYEVYGSKNANEYLNKLIDFNSNCRYVGVITDSATTLTSAAVNWHMGFSDKNKTRSSTDPIKIPSWDEYKSETSLVSQALDISKGLPCHVIWTAHPLPSVKLEGSGKSISVSKVNNIVSYGGKVAGMIPGSFNEIYHFSKTVDYSQTPTVIKNIVNTVGLGDDFAKTVLDLPAELDITNKLFWEVWKAALAQKEAEYDVSALGQTSA